MNDGFRTTHELAGWLHATGAYRHHAEKTGEHYRTGPANARFWVWHRTGWVKLALRPGEDVRVHDGGPTDEGFSSDSTRWTHDGDSVRMDWHSHGRDCDGRYERGGCSVCPLELLRSRPMDGPDAPSENAGICAPEWARRGEHQRDYAAEAAGY